MTPQDTVTPPVTPQEMRTRASQQERRCGWCKGSFLDSPPTDRMGIAAQKACAGDEPHTTAAMLRLGADAMEREQKLTEERDRLTARWETAKTGIEALYALPVSCREIGMALEVMRELETRKDPA